MGNKYIMMILVILLIYLVFHLVFARELDFYDVGKNQQEKKSKRNKKRSKRFGFGSPDSDYKFEIVFTEESNSNGQLDRTIEVNCENCEEKLNNQNSPGEKLPLGLGPFELIMFLEQQFIKKKQTYKCQANAVRTEDCFHSTCKPNGIGEICKSDPSLRCQNVFSRPNLGEPGYSCKPKEILKGPFLSVECNACRCGNDGISAICDYNENNDCTPLEIDPIEFQENFKDPDKLPKVDEIENIIKINKPTGNEILKIVEDMLKNTSTNNDDLTTVDNSIATTESSFWPIPTEENLPTTEELEPTESTVTISTVND